MAKNRWTRDYTKDIVDAKKRFDDVKKHVKEPPDGQVPVGNWGIYTSPNLQSNEPVSPFDCDQYPDSPYCGGTPWTKTPVGLEPEWGINECGAWVQLNPVIGFTKLPPVSVGWRRPGKCREEEKPPSPPEPTDTSRPVSPVRFPKNIPPETIVFVVLILKYKFESVFDSAQISSDPGTTTTVTTEALSSSRYPIVDALVPAYLPNGGMVPAIGIADAVVKQSTTILRRNTIDFRETSGNAKAWISSDQRPPQEPNFKRYTVRTLTGNYRITGFLPSGWNDANQSRGVIMHGNFAEIAADWNGYVVDSKAIFNAGQTIYIYKEEYEIAYISIPDSDKYPPPPDQKRKKDCCMQCCSGGNQAANKQNQDNAEILRLLRKLDKKMGEYPFNVVLFDANDEKVGAQKKTVSVADVAKGQKLIVEREEKNAKSIGIDQFPIYAPSSNVKDESNGLIGDLGDLKNKIFKQKIESIAELISWKIKQDHEVFGQWQEYIEIQDSDPNVKGNQPKRVVLPNMARSFRELVLLNSIQIKSTGMLLDSLLKMYVDVAGIKVLVAQIKAVIEDVQDFLDYPTTEKHLDVPMGITIPSKGDDPDDIEDIKRFLSNSTIKAKFDDWTGEGSIHDMLVVLLEAASMIKAAFYERS